MTTDNTIELERLLDDAAEETRSLSKYRGIEWGNLSQAEFERVQAEIFRSTKAAAKQRRVAEEIRELDEEAEARRRRDAEPRDVTVTLQNSG